MLCQSQKIVFCKVGAKVHEWARYEICFVNLKRSFSAKWVPKCTRGRATRYVVSVSKDFVSKGANTLNRINAINEKLARAYEPELKQHSSEFRHVQSP